MKLGPEMEQFLAPFRDNRNYIVNVTERNGRPSVLIIHRATLKRLAEAKWDDEAANTSMWKKLNL